MIPSVTEQRPPRLHRGRVHIEHPLHLQSGSDGFPRINGFYFIRVNLTSLTGIGDLVLFDRKIRPVNQRILTLDKIEVVLTKISSSRRAKTARLWSDGGKEPVIKEDLVRAVGIILLFVISPTGTAIAGGVDNVILGNKRRCI